MEIEAEDAMREWQKMLEYTEKFLDLRDAYGAPPTN